MPIVDIGSDDIVINGDLEVTGKMTRPVGSIEITNTYSNPSSYLAGTWTLINKVFTSLGSSSSDIFTRDSNNTSSSTPYMTRNGQAINLHISVKTSVALGDTSVILGVVEFPFIGITGLMNSVYSIGSSDTGDGVVLLTMDYQTGTLRSTDVVTKTSGGTIASGSTITADFTFVVGSGSMINEKCSQFVWKRTA